MIRAIITILTVAAAGAAGLYGGDAMLDTFLPDKAEARPEEPLRRNAARVSLARAERQAISETVEAVGTTLAERSVSLRPASEGRIVELGFETGSRVNEGDLLVQFDDRAERAALKQAEATYVRAQGDLERARSLSERNVTSTATLEQARAELLAAEAAVEAAQKAVDDRRIIAPFAGTTGITDLDVGQRIDGTTVITTLDDLSAVEIAFSLPETYYGRAKPGLTVEATTAAYPGRTFTGTVSQIGTRIDPATRAFPLRARIENQERALAAGMFMNVQVELGERRSVTVPEQGIVGRGNANYVFVAENGTARRQEVEIGRRLGESVEIVEGLEENARVVVGGIQAIEDGDAIDPVEAAAPDPRRPIG